MIDFHLYKRNIERDREYWANPDCWHHHGDYQRMCDRVFIVHIAIVIQLMSVVTHGWVGLGILPCIGMVLLLGKVIQIMCSELYELFAHWISGRN